MLMPLVPNVVPAPVMSMLRRMTLSVASALTMTPCTPEERTLPIVPVQSIMIDLVMVTAPNPPGSRQLMMPGLAVFEIAPAKVLQGAVRLHGLASSPTPETQVRVACACASEAKPRANSTTKIAESFFTLSPPQSIVCTCARHQNPTRGPVKNDGRQV